MKYEWLHRHDIDAALDQTGQIDVDSADYNETRPHEAVAWNRPRDVHLGPPTHHPYLRERRQPAKYLPRDRHRGQRKELRG